jgi:hypothetical protein
LKSVVVLFQTGSGGLASWTAPSAVTLTGVWADGGTANVAIAADPTLDVGTLFSAGISVFDHLIAVLSAPGFRIFSTPVLEGQTVYFSADSNCSVQLCFNNPAEI